jgi:predicted metal-binding membrane protein
MTPAARERAQVRAPVLFVSAAAWMLLALEPGALELHAHHAGMMLRVSLDLLLAHNPPGTLALGWALMLAAMMGPLIIAPLRHVRDRSFARRRARAIALFVAGYAAVWMAAGLVLTALAMTVRMFAAESLVPLGMASAVALVWQFSPLKQRCLNRGHAHPRLPAFGRAADIGALRFGLTHGVWCAGSCWALMLLPLLVARGHIVAMAAVTLWLSTERLQMPEAPRWRWRLPVVAGRIAVGQARLRLKIV